MGKWNYDTISSLFRENKCTLLSTGVINSASMLQYRCECGNESKIRLFDFIKGNRCKDCGINKQKNKSKLSFEHVAEYYENHGCVLISKEYINNYNNLTFICECGNTHTSTFDKFKKSPRCPDCGNKLKAEKQKFSIEFIRDYFSQNDCELLSTEYVNATQKLDYRCVCGNISQITYGSFMSGHRCRKCGNIKSANNNRHSLEHIRNIFSENGCTLLTTKYQNSAQLLEFLCDCGNIGELRLYDFQCGIRCSKCTSKRRSAFQKGVKRPERRGENSPNWDFTKTLEERTTGRLFEGYKDWRSSVYHRDEYTCQCCGDNEGGNLNAHHLDGYDWCIDKRIDINNGITLCDFCHDDFHGIYGYGENTKEQWDEYVVNLYLDDPIYELI